MDGMELTKSKYYRMDYKMLLFPMDNKKELTT